MRVVRPVVARSPADALGLGRRYRREVERASRGALRLRTAGEELGLRLLGVGPMRLRFGPPEVAVDDAGVR